MIVTVTVALPYYGVPEYVEQAVRCVLAQTYRDLRLIVIGDGEEPPIGHVRDSRLTVYTLPENRGTYFALQLMLSASPDEWHAPHGADDWTEPTHLEGLLAVGQDAVALGTCWVHTGDSAMVTSIGREGWHVGIFAADRLRSIGGYDPSARLSQDTNVLKLLDMTGGYHRHESVNPTYHLRRRPGSLTVAPETGMSSPARRVARRRDQQIRAKCRSLRTPQRIREYRYSQVPAAVSAELAQHVDALSARL